MSPRLHHYVCSWGDSGHEPVVMLSSWNVSGYVLHVAELCLNSRVNFQWHVSPTLLTGDEANLGR